MMLPDKITTLAAAEFPPLLAEITDPPKKLYVRGIVPPPEHKWLCVVGSRSYSPYAKDAVEKLVGGLAGYPVVIVSGLALGIDALAHKVALAHKLPTVSIPGSGLNWNTLYPRSHETLARAIVESGGALVSEFEPEFTATPWSFPQRNRIMAGLSHATLIIEASEQSGTLITARLALEYNREVFAVPGHIFDTNALGTNTLLQRGAVLITSTADVLTTLGLEPRKNESDTSKIPTNLSEHEHGVLSLLGTQPLSIDSVVSALSLSASTVATALTTLELRGLVKDIGQKKYIRVC